MGVYILRKLLAVMSVTLLLLVFLCGCQNISVDQQKRNDAGQTASVTIQELHAYDTFMDGNLLITCMGLYGSEKDRSTDRRNVTISMKFTNTTDFDTNITATQFAVTFNGYPVNYVSKREYVNESFTCSCSLFLGAIQ